VLGVSTVLGVLGVIAAFGLFYLGERVLHLDRAHIQTMMYLKLSVAGHLTIFLTRTRGPFWSIRPARILWGAVLGTQLLATCIAIFGLGLVTPLAWYWALLVWGWALAWFLLNDRAKLLTYWLLDRVRAEEGATVACVQPPSTPKSASAAGAQPADAPPEQPHAASPVSDKSPGVDKAKIAASRDTKLGEVLLAAVRKDPAGAGHFIAQAIDDAGVSEMGSGSPVPKAMIPAAPTTRAAE
jgi:hypothetical protein